MASGYHMENGRRSRMNTSRRGMYVYGSTIRQAEALPERRPDTQKPEKKASRQVRRNRNRAMSIDFSFTVFLTVAAVCAVLMCMMYLRLQSDVISRSEHVTELQEQLADLQEENSTAYHAAVSSVNLQDVYYKAIYEMGMVYSSEGNVIEYKSPTSSYVKQYNDIPTDGLSIQSSDVSE